MGANESPLSRYQIIGRGELYVAIYDPVTGVLGPELYMDNIQNFSPNIDVEKAKLYSSSDAAGGLVASAVVRTTGSIKFKGSGYRREIQEIWGLGDGSALANTVGAVTNENIPATKVKKGYWFPVARRNISSVVLTTVGGGTTYSAVTDYKVDPIVGRIKVLETSTIVDAVALEVDYSSGTDTSKTVRGITLGKKEAYVRFVPDNTTGDKFEAEFWRVSLSPDGEMPFITENDFASWSMSGEILSDAANHPSEPYYRIIAR